MHSTLRGASPSSTRRPRAASSPGSATSSSARRVTAPCLPPGPQSKVSVDASATLAASILESHGVAATAPTSGPQQGAGGDNLPLMASMDSIDQTGLDECDIALIESLDIAIGALAKHLDDAGAVDAGWEESERLLTELKELLLRCSASSCGQELRTHAANAGGLTLCMRLAGAGSIVAYECLQTMILNNVAVAGRCIKAGVMSLLDAKMSTGREEDVAVALFVLASLVHVNREHSYFIKSGMLPDVIRITGDAASSKCIHTFNGRANMLSARACSVLVNLANNAKNHEEMVAQKAPEAMARFLETSNLSKAVRLKAVFALALLVGKKETSEGHNMLELDRDTLDSIMTACWKALECETAFDYPFILWKVLQALSQLTLNDINKKLFLEMKIEELLSQVLLRIETNTISAKTEYPRLAQRFALSTVWNIAFLEDGKQRLLAQPELLQCVRKAAVSAGSPRTKQEARGALWTLGDREYVQAYFEKASIDEDTKPGQRLASVMISYAHEDTTVVTELHGQLETAGFRVLRNADNSLELMAQAVEGSSVVLCCCSNAYQESQMCRTEAEYAYGQRKPILPINMQKGFQPTGWLGALVGTHTSYQLHDSSRTAAVCEALIADLKKRTDADRSVAEEAQTAVRASKRDEAAVSAVDKWTTSDVKAWLATIGVPGSVQQMWAYLGVDGRALRGLALLRNDRSLATTLRRDMGVRNPVHLLHIVNALDSLL